MRGRDRVRVSTLASSACAFCSSSSRCSAATCLNRAAGCEHIELQAGVQRLEKGWGWRSGRGDEEGDAAVRAASGRVCLLLVC